VLALFVPVQIQANTFVIKEWQETYTLVPFTQIAADNIGEITAENIDRHLRNVPFQQLGQQDFTLEANQYYWGKLVLQNNLPDAARYKEWILDISYSLTEFEIFFQAPDGRYHHQLNGLFRSHQLKDFVPILEGSFTKIILPPKQNITIYIRAKSSRKSIPPDFEVDIQHITSFYEQLQTDRRNHAFFLGFIVMALLFNIILYFFGRDKSFIFYSIYLLALIIYASFSTGDLADWLEPTLFPNHPEYNYLGKLFIYIGLMAYIAFMRSFLKLNELLPKWDVFFKGLFWIGLPWLVVDFIVCVQSGFSYVDADPITFVYILLFFFSNLVFICYLAKTRDKKAYFIIAGIVLWFGGTILTVISWLQTPAFALIYLKIGSIFEIIAFSLGLAYRQREHVKDKQKAYFQLEKSKMLQEQEQAETQRLKELEELKSNLYTNITHEFRTPLTVIQGMAEQIKHSNYAQETQLIRRNSKNLLQLVNQLLDLSKLESGKLALNMVQGNIIPYLRYISESFQSFAANKNIQFNITTVPTELVMDYDEEKLLNILSNLLFNAIKFTPENGQVQMQVNIVETDKKHLQILVTDTGIGIPEQQLPYIFDRFYQVEGGNTRKAIGTGIGLSITQELIQLLNGRIQVKSKINQGTTFEVLLPITNKASVYNKTYDRQASELVPELSLATVTETANLIADKELPLLLLIEDNEDVLHYLIACLKGNYQIITALNGQQGLDTALSRIPDLIISDVMMPEMGGYEVCARLKAIDTSCHIPIILLTAKVDQAAKIEGLKQGADAYLAKPFDQEELEVRIAQLLNQRKKLQAYYAQHITASHLAPLPIEDTFIQKVIDLIEKDLSANLPLEELYQALNKSQSQVYRKIKAVTGYSTTIFIRRIRLKNAYRLLTTTNLSVSEIAYKVGFNDPSFFSSSFSEVFGQSPRNIRAKQ